MDDVDSRQQAELDQLSAAAKDNRRVDRAQWAVMAAVAGGLLIYMNLVLAGVIKTQAATIAHLQEKCK